jgi:thioredoxin 1
MKYRLLFTALFVSAVLIWAGCAKSGEKEDPSMPGNGSDTETESSDMESGGHSSGSEDDAEGGGGRGKPVAVTSEDHFNTVISENKVVLVDFYADWCPPCKKLKPIVHEIAHEYKGKITVAAVDTDKLGNLAQKYGVTGIPDVRIFHNGAEHEKIVGLSAKSTYTSVLDKLVE